MMYDVREHILEERPIITKSELNKLILEQVESNKLAEGPVKRDLLKLLTDTDYVIEEAREKFSEEITNFTTSSEELKKEKQEEKPKKKPRTLKTKEPKEPKVKKTTRKKAIKA